jgi:tripartite-type tricarboxylate transporter receptor subunit TctC
LLTYHRHGTQTVWEDGMRVASLVLAIVGGLALTSPSAAQEGWPTRPVRIIVPFPPGGTTDIIARVVQQRLGERLGQQVIVENRAGAAGTTGTEAMVRSSDGHTLAIVISSLASNVALQPKLPFRVPEDIVPITFAGLVPNLIGVHPSVEARSLPELIARAKTKPGSLNFATSGVGTANHFAGELLKQVAQIDIVHTPYRGGGPAINDLVGGQVPIGINALSSVLPHVQGGRVRALATTGARRSPTTPDVPTVAELGYPGFEVVEWWGFVAPLSMPMAGVNRLHRELVAILGSAEIVDKLAAQGVEVSTSTPDEFRAFLGQEVRKLDALVKTAGIKVD